MSQRKFSTTWNGIPIKVASRIVSRYAWTTEELSHRTTLARPTDRPTTRLVSQVLLWLIASVVCATAVADSESSFRPDTSVVLKTEAGRDLIKACGPIDSVAEQWDPEPAELATLDAALLPALASALKSAKDDSDPKDYFRQYAGGFSEGDHIIYVLGFHRSYIEALPKDIREYWRSSPVRGGPGHTRFWCAYWVKETKYLIQQQQDGSVRSVRFVGSKATIFMQPRGLVTIGPMEVHIPVGYAFQGSWIEGDAVVGDWLHDSGGMQTRLDIRLFDMRSVALRSTPEEIAHLSERCLQESLGAIEKRRTDFQAYPVRHLYLAGDPAVSTEWKGKLDGAPSVGELYCSIAQKRYAVAFNILNPGEAPAPAVSEAIKAIEAATRRGD